ncbi:hypothetical protein C8R43DRAFT_1118317 [Mycena crocata]|nr:hypothetical protein C8R43DRAFT_1118317 [Mycena crocata]
MITLQSHNFLTNLALNSKSPGKIVLPSIEAVLSGRFFPIWWVDGGGVRVQGRWGRVFSGDALRLGCAHNSAFRAPAESTLFIQHSATHTASRGYVSIPEYRSPHVAALRRMASNVGRYAFSFFGSGFGLRSCGCCVEILASWCPARCTLARHPQKGICGLLTVEAFCKAFIRRGGPGANVAFSGFVQTFKQFLALRSLFGIGMGGIWGLAASTVLENLPAELRGLTSGVLQQGYAVGYLVSLHFILCGIRGGTICEGFDGRMARPAYFHIHVSTADAIRTLRFALRDIGACSRRPRRLDVCAGRRLHDPTDATASRPRPVIHASARLRAVSDINCDAADGRMDASGLVLTLTLTPRPRPFPISCIFSKIP